MIAADGVCASRRSDAIFLARIIAVRRSRAGLLAVLGAQASEFIGGVAQ